MFESLDLEASAVALNAASHEDVRLLLERCCGSPRWVELMLAARPFADGAALAHAGEKAFATLEEHDWRAAFAAHPRIGQRMALEEADALEESAAPVEAATRASIAAAEQASTALASSITLARLAEGNALYEERFGHVYLVFATGKTSEQMLEILEDRLQNSREQEMDNAAREQRKISALRLSRVGSIKT